MWVNWKQRVLNDLQSGRLSCGRLIRLHDHPVHPPLPPASCLSPHSSIVWYIEFTDERGGRGLRGAES